MFILFYMDLPSC